MRNINCGCLDTCTCTPTPCVDGCLTDTKTDCTFLSEDLDICSEIIPKGSPVTEALSKLGAAVCDGITVTVQDMKVKVDASDTTTGYLFDKLTVGNSLSKTITNPAGNETIRLDARLDTVTGGNILTTTANGLYVPTPNPTGYNLTSLFSSTVNLTLASVLGGQTIKADAKISPNAGNALVDNGGLYVSIPAATGNTTVSATSSNAITTVSTLAGTNYNINSVLKIDPSSTAPISITSQGLKVDCCAPAVQAQTPISIVMPTDSGLNLTATGIDNHTLNASVKISPAVGNALTTTVAGLYCPTAGGAAATTINDTPTVDATLVSPGVYTLAVKKSTDSCNALINGTDGGLYVNGIEEPNSLGFVVDGTDIYFEFQGPSTTNTDYEVEIQGTTGSPTTWIPASFDSLAGGVLRYAVGPTGISATVRGRVRLTCDTNTSNWVGETFIPPFTLVSEDGSVSIAAGTSGVTNEWNIQVGGSNVLWDDTWKAVPITWALNSVSVANAYYKITKDGKLLLRGYINLAVNGYGYPTGGYNQVSLDFLQVHSSVYSILNPNTLFATNTDVYPLSMANLVSGTTNVYTESITRIGDTFTADFTIFNSGAGLTNGIILPLSQLKIE